MSRAIAFVKAVFGGWLQSWLFLLWSVLILFIGVSLGVFAAITAIEANGIRVTDALARMAGL